MTRGRWRSSPALVSGLHVTPDERIGPQPVEIASGRGVRRVRRGAAGRTRRRRSRASRRALRSTSSQTSSASRPGRSMSTTVPPPASVASAAQRPVPCMSGLAGSTCPRACRRGPRRSGRAARCPGGPAATARRRGRRCATSRPWAARWCRPCRGGSGRAARVRAPSTSPVGARRRDRRLVRRRRSRAATGRDASGMPSAASRTVAASSGACTTATARESSRT